MSKYVLITMMISLPFLTTGQSHNYWTRSFNEESSLLSGAVVGGGSGPSAIYYNPASISEVEASKFSLNASLVSFEFINAKNALGEGINLDDMNAKIEPRFISYMLKPKRHQNLSFEIAFLNNENEEGTVSASVDQKMDILTHIPGDERYFAFYQYNAKFRDDWIGAGFSTQLNKRVIVGLSMFVTIKSLKYSNSMEIEAYPLSDSANFTGGDNSFHAATYTDNYYLNFNDYRLLWKAGVLFKWDYLSLGLTITTPSVGGIYSDGKRVERKEQQANITYPETGDPIPDYLITDYQEKGNVDVSFRTPFSVSAGLTYRFRDHKRILYLSMEYFSAIDPYRMVEAEESALLTSGNENGLNDCLTYASGAKPVFNAALGYSWTLNQKLLLKAGFRTDFNYQKNLDYEDLAGIPTVQKLNVDHYYITCGLSWKLMGQDIITGVQYCLGRSSDQKQIINLSDPMEYNFTEQKALQGTRTNDLVSLYNSVIIYLGFSFNFGEKKNP